MLGAVGGARGPRLLEARPLALFLRRLLSAAEIRLHVHLDCVIFLMLLECNNIHW